MKKGDVVTVTVAEVQDGGLEVALEGGAKAFIRRADLARDRNDQRPERFGVGDKIDALVTSVDKAGRKIALSIKAREVAEEKEAVEQYGSSEFGREPRRHPGRGSVEGAEEERRVAVCKSSKALAPSERAPFSLRTESYIEE